MFAIAPYLGYSPVVTYKLLGRPSKVPKRIYDPNIKTENLIDISPAISILNHSKKGAANEKITNPANKIRVITEYIQKALFKTLAYSFSLPLEYNWVILLVI